MRIQHNIMAMSAYRNYTNNVSAMKANLEKLSSGYKINRAGDDAAGLAISEKMRAQITGLETAQKNAKDGISLVQTAEGALTEVHDMLNRMVELATQSANGTYDNDTDRAQLQKEMDQLKDEINRIADSSNFNGIKLLDGSMAVETSSALTDIKGTTAATADNAFTIIADGQLGVEPQAGKFTYDLSQLKLTIVVDAGGNVSAQSDEGGIPVTQEDSTPVYSADSEGNLTPLENDDDPSDDGSSGGSSNTVTLSIGGFSLDLDLDAFGIDTGTAGTYTISGADVVTEIAKQMQDAIDTAAAANSSSSNGGSEGGTEESDSIPVPLEAGISAQASTAAGAWAGGTLAGANVSVYAQGTTLVVEMESAPTQAWSATEDMTLRFSNGVAPATGGTANGGEQFAPTVEVEPVDSTKSRMYAQAKIDLNNVTIKDGTALKIGDTTYTFAVGADSKFKNAENVIDLTDRTTSSTDLANVAANRLTQVAKNNAQFIVGSTTQGVVSLTEREGGIDYTKNNLAGANGLGTQGTNAASNGTDTSTGTDAAGATFNYQDATLNDWKGLIAFGTSTVSGTGLTLQIGDTADSYNQLNVSIKDCHTSSLGLDSVSIADQESAQAAVDAIKNAINYVSDVRGTLGATQNRLDHTINNLSVMTENIQDAESTIRDVDVAEEMMAYTKNNILIQASQAMLAQANQVPQGVLQLLQ